MKEKLEIFLEKNENQKKKTKKQKIHTENELVENLKKTYIMEDGRQLLNG